MFRFFVEIRELGVAGAVVFFKQVQGFVYDSVCRGIAPGRELRGEEPVEFGGERDVHGSLLGHAGVVGRFVYAFKDRSKLSRAEEPTA